MTCTPCQKRKGILMYITILIIIVVKSVHAVPYTYVHVHTPMSFTTYSRTVSAARADCTIAQPNQFTSNDGTAESETKVITVGFEERD